MVADDYYGFDDALYDACRLVSLVSRSGRTLSGLVADFPVYVSTPEIRIDVSEEQKWTIVDQAVAHFKRSHDVIDVDGGHSSMLREPFVQSLASALVPLLATSASIRTPVAPLEKP